MCQVSRFNSISILSYLLDISSREEEEVKVKKKLDIVFFVNYKNTVFGLTLRDDVVQKHWTIKMFFYTMCRYFIVDPNFDPEV